MTSLKVRRSKRALAPSSNEFEVSIFGPGKGEAVAIHLGGGDWVTVDSCVDQRSKSNALLAYFNEIGVDPATALRLVVGTHAHDDHIAGISDIYESASDSTFVCSSAITSEEFLRAVQIDDAVAAGVRPSIRREYQRIFEIARDRQHEGRKPIRRAIEDRVVWQRGASEVAPAAEVLCLSPSDEAVSRALDDLARNAVSPIGSRKRFTNRDPNEFAVALWVTFGDQRVLLGADLPVGPAGCGWMAVMENVPPTSRASLFKVPHHGSMTGHYDPVWDELVEGNPVALLAPFRGGRKPLPSPEDVRRIERRTSRGYITASPRPVARKASARRLGSTLDGLGNVRDPWGTVGHVRARRKPAGTTWAVETFDPARELSRVR